MAALEQHHYDDEPKSLLGEVDPDRDACSRAGALRLKEKIESYWRDRGHDVFVTVHFGSFVPTLRGCRVEVRSNMKNGLPPAAIPSSEQVNG